MLQKNVPRDPALRSKIAEQLADHVLAHGLGAASLRPLAAAIGTSDRMLLYYFPDKAALIAAILDVVAARMTAMLDAVRLPEAVPRAALETHMLPLLLDDAVWPFMQLWLEIASLAARGDAACLSVGERVARGFVAWTDAQLAVDDEAQRSHEAVRLLMTVEGAVLLKSLGLGNDVAAAMTRLT